MFHMANGIEDRQPLEQLHPYGRQVANGVGLARLVDTLLQSRTWDPQIQLVASYSAPHFDISRQPHSAS
jgi:hypothetical protein